MKSSISNKVRYSKDNKAEKDKVYTPPECARDCMEKIRYHIGPDDILFEPFYGKGAFYNEFGDNPKIATEIDMGTDFFNITDNFQMTYIITNPPYSILNKVLDKMMKLENLKGFGFLVNNLSMTPKRLQDLEDKGFYPTDAYQFKIWSWFGYQYFWFFKKLDTKPMVNFSFKRDCYK